MKKLLILPLLMLVFACSSGGGGGSGDRVLEQDPTNAGDDDGNDNDGNNDDDNNNGDDDVVEPVPVEEETLRIGRGFGDAFVQSQLDLAVETLSAGGSTTVSASLVNGNGTAFSQDLSVAFGSTCISEGLSTIVTPITSVNGRAQTTYVAQGCEGDDEIRASVVFNGESQGASGVVTVAPAELGSINFVSAVPSNIGLRGTGGAGRQETSTVIFRVRDKSGGEVRGQLVRFRLSTTTGGIELSTDAACSNADGTVQTVVQAGNVATVVRITAQLIDDETRGPNGRCIAESNDGIVLASSQSDELTITTGIPDSNSVTLAAGTLNLEGLDIVNTTSVTAFLSDRFNNPVPAGTAVQFRTEGGSVGGQCTVDESGQCSVTFRTQNPLPGEAGRSNRGRSTVMAFAIGEESFIDDNGNGFFDPGDIFTSANDLPEAFIDNNENGVRDGSEEFVDFDEDTFYTFGNGEQSSLLCDDPRCDFESDGVTPQLLSVFGSLPIIFSGPASQILFYRPGDEPQFGGGDTVTPCDNGMTADPDAFMCGETYVLLVCDPNDNIPPFGTAIAFNLNNLTLANPTSTSVPNTNQFGGFFRTLTLQPAGEQDQGILGITATTPSGVQSGTSITATGCIGEL